MSRALHSPEQVRAFRAELRKEPLDRLDAALADLDGFRRSYFETGCVASFTRLVVESCVEDRRRRRR